ncbi:2,3-bisphosphoglycerate-independent phosphoglycerate mutase [archaeon]|nr:2,3-bisphosphoglycerate-independent phosphoglycerate mutase [archaeon]
MKTILIIADGAGDRPEKALKNRTPFQAAHTPNLNALATKGINGIMDVIAPGIKPGSDTGHLALFGYDPHDYYTGRGPFEAAGAGITLKKGDVAFRCNMGTVKNGVVADRRAGRKPTSEFVEALKQIKIETVHGVTPIVADGIAHRFALVLRGQDLSWRVTNSDPHDTGMPVQQVKPLEKTGGALRTAKACSEFMKKAEHILATHPSNKTRDPPANAVLIRGAGIATNMPAFETKYGLSTAAIAKGTLYEGVARMLGMEVITPKTATGDKNEDCMAFAKETKKALKRKDFVFLHIKGPDLAGHDGKPEEKVETIESIDEMIGELLDLDALIAFTCDHSTPCNLKGHSGDPVPIAIAGEGIRTDNVTHFDEIACAQGGLHRIRGSDLMPILLNILNLNEKYGA